MAFSDSIKAFNNKHQLTLGWYWLLPSKKLKTKKTQGVNFWGKELVLYRGDDQKVRVMDAFCPHMGAHLKDGFVKDNEIRCFFHYWKFNEKGECTDIPCQKHTGGIPKIKTWPVQEKYGMIWIWPGDEALEDVPVIPELSGIEVDWSHGKPYKKNCHPNVLMINAIDEQHFASVHNVFVDLWMEDKTLSKSCIQFNNTTMVDKATWFKRLMHKLYDRAITYQLTYWYGSTGAVMLGPKFIHFYIMFAIRPTVDGRAEGQTILITKKRTGLKGLFLNPILLFLTKLVGNYFAKGDTVVFQNINFNFKAPIKADHAIVAFIQHLENQASSNWKHPNWKQNQLLNQVSDTNESSLHFDLKTQKMNSKPLGHQENFTPQPL